ncbi:MAG: GNAT family N-acetyltransferase [Chloroflexi bacterium]|nr:GNAT family N-acetyltransferase [Chloroflexota bacterium]
MIRKAEGGDLPQVADLFQRAFEESITHLFGKRPKDEVFVDVCNFLLELFPDFFLVAIEEGRVAGFIITPPALSAIPKNAVFKGYLFKWIIGWLRGRYGFGIRPLGVFATDKWTFLTTKNELTEKTDAGILAIAVDPDLQKKGIGTSLLDMGMRLLAAAGVGKVMLEVRAWNEHANALYKKFGFREVGSYQDSEGVWIRMIADVDGAA